MSVIIKVHGIWTVLTIYHGFIMFYLFIVVVVGFFYKIVMMQRERESEVERLMCTCFRIGPSPRRHA